MRSIELEFNPQVQQHFFELAPSAETAAGASVRMMRKQAPASLFILQNDAVS
ncbi:hypothetical protein [Paenibacillus ihuae]|uniref:hypothetical protein n=1 Tax=Paenibacillus ihuae TaxID=1232431 RepID=UPI001ADF48BD|nr:hypothetical protein [Paenibacillus ihuae]